MYPDKSKIYLYKGNHKSQTYGEIEGNRKFEFGGDCYDGNDGCCDWNGEIKSGWVKKVEHFVSR